MSIVSVGTMAIDFIETPYGRADAIVGGANPFICLAASYLAPQVNLVSVVGHDFPVEFLEMLEGRGINLDGLEQRPDGKSFSWTGRYHLDMNGRDTLATDLNVLATFNPVLPESYRHAEFVMLGNLEPGIQRSVVEQMASRPKLVVLDTMNFWMDVALDALRETIALADVLTINDEEARQLTGERSLRKAAIKILSGGLPYLVIKKGEHGALLFHKDEVFFAPAMPLEDVVDPTGAGDTFAGGFIGHIAATGDTSFENMKRALIVGSTMASFCVEQFGTAGLLHLTPEAIRTRRDQFEKLTSYTFNI